MKLKAEGISRNYYRNGKSSNYFTAVEKTDFELKEGTLTGIIGKSGSGKTTLINMLSGLLCPTEGRVLMDGQSLYHMSDRERSNLRNRHIGVIPQGQTGLQSFTVLENVLLPVSMYRNSEPKKEEALALLKKLGLEELSDVYSNELSGGELRRMSIARAVINDPSVIIADEPTADLDEDTTKMVMEMFRQQAQQGKAVLIVTHDKEVMEQADNLYTMENGKLKQIK